MYERTLSSVWTIWTKFVFPAVWISGFGLTAILLFSGVLVDKNNATPPGQVNFGFLAVWILGTAFILWSCAGLKLVRVGDGKLHVSNYIREIAVPFSAIADVRQNRWLSYRPITIYFKNATEFGDKVVFMPEQSILFWRTDAAVSELKRLAGLAP